MKASRKLLSLNVVGTTQAVPCPVGKRIRIVSVFFSVTPTPGQNEQASVTFQRGNVTLAASGSGPAGDNVTEAFGAIGNGDPVANGANALILPFPLPDFWWPFEIRVINSFALTPPTTGTILYELDNLSP